MSRVAIVVLGAPLAPGDRLSEILVERVEAAAALYREMSRTVGATSSASPIPPSAPTSEPPLVVATGGRTRGARRSEADVIAEALVERGIADVIVESESLTTEQNARFTADLLALHGVQSAIIVTQPFHRRRAAWLFREAGLDARAHHIVDSVQYRDRVRALKWTMRECAAWAKLLSLRMRSRLLRRRRRRGRRGLR